jgi:hypothetical protein
MSKQSLYYINTINLILRLLSYKLNVKIPYTIICTFHKAKYNPYKILVLIYDFIF